MTQFQQTMLATENGTMQVPTVSTSEGSIPFAGYQLAVHVYALRIMALGMKMRGVTFTQIKKYYGLTGRTAKDCVPELQKIQKLYSERAQIN
jgi:hypothetical protein